MGEAAAGGGERDGAARRSLLAERTQLHAFSVPVARRARHARAEISRLELRFASAKLPMTSRNPPPQEHRRPAMPAASELLRQLFPDGTGEPGPESIAALRSQHVREALHGRGALVLTYVLLQLGLPLALLAASGSFVPALIAGAILLLVPIVFYAIQASQAEAQFWREYAAARGFQHRAKSQLHAECPLYSRGDEQRFEHLLAGRIGPLRGTLAHFISTEITRDSKGRKSRSDTPFTVVHLELPAAVARRFRGVYLRERSFSLGKLQDLLAHDRAVNLASAEFDQRYSLRVVDEQDDIALLELFSTTFIDELIREFYATWEQRDGDLVIYCRGRRTSARELDEFCAAAARVAERYLEEHR
jgi:hypothetical protein